MIGPAHLDLYDDVLQRFRWRLIEHERRALLEFRGKTDGEARAYLRQIAVSVALNILKKEKRLQKRFVRQAEESPKHAEAYGDPAAPDEKAMLLRQAMDECLERILPKKNRARYILMFKLALDEGLSPQEIASLGPVKK